MDQTSSHRVSAAHVYRKHHAVQSGITTWPNRRLCHATGLETTHNPLANRQKHAYMLNHVNTNVLYIYVYISYIISMHKQKDLKNQWNDKFT